MKSIFFLVVALLPLGFCLQAADAAKRGSETNAIRVLINPLGLEEFAVFDLILTNTTGTEHTVWIPPKLAATQVVLSNETSGQVFRVGLERPAFERQVAQLTPRKIANSYMRVSIPPNAALYLAELNLRLRFPTAKPATYKMNVQQLALSYSTNQNQFQVVQLIPASAYVRFASEAERRAPQRVSDPKEARDDY